MLVTEFLYGGVSLGGKYVFASVMSLYLLVCILTN